MLVGTSRDDWLRNIAISRSGVHDEFVFNRLVTIQEAEQEVGFRVLESLVKHVSATELVNNRYGWRGYGTSHSIPRGVHHKTFVAERGDEVVGTITLAFDSSEGLAADQHFKDEVDALRDVPGSRLCELTRLAFMGELRSRDVLAGLFHLSYVYGTLVDDCTDLLIEVAPRHVGFYRSMLGFQPVGSVRRHHGVNTFSQLMQLKVDAIRQNIQAYAGTLDDDQRRSLYPCFFPPSIEHQLRSSLAVHLAMPAICPERLAATTETVLALPTASEADAGRLVRAA